tara:strand:- start:204 stop:362 length:159 start_codon:yes stop_codon:yes gene_type:complete
MEKGLKCLKCYGTYLLAGFAGWEFAKSDWMVAIPAALIVAYMAYKCSTRCKM